MNMNEVQQPFMHEDLIIDILSRLSPTFVVRCKCVCKSWLSIIQDRQFIEMHRLRGKLIPITCSSFKCILSIHGLVLEFCDIKKLYRIRNHATNQVLKLPTPNGDMDDISMYYIPSTNEYKLLYRYYKDTSTLNNIGMQILTIGTENIWRSVEIPFSDYHEEIDSEEGIDGAMYILYSCNNQIKAKMIKFQLEDESFMEILTPKEIMPQVICETNLRLFKWDENISIYCLVEETMYAWILMDLKKSKWEERRIVFPSSLFAKYPHILEDFFPFEVEESWLYMLDDGNKNLCYNIINQTITEEIVDSCLEDRNSIVWLKGMESDNNA